MTKTRRIAVLGATSQIAKDLVMSCAKDADKHLHLFARRPGELRRWLTEAELPAYATDDLIAFPQHEFDAVINFIGVGDPAKLVQMGNSIFDLTLQFDNMVLGYLLEHPDCRYLFLSSGSVYGSKFFEPAREDTLAIVPVNTLTPADWYGVAKLHAECRHRAHPGLCIFDIRVFNYFSRTQDINARFLITDMLRAIRDKTVLKTSPDYIVRDYLHPSDFYNLVCALLSAPAANAGVDCYSRAPIDKPNLLAAMQERFGLRYEVAEATASVNATGGKPHYYSLNRRAADFGYLPKLSSLEGVLRESESILH